MLSSRGLFSHITCPNAATCELPNCLFSHDIFVFTPNKKSNERQAKATAQSSSVKLPQDRGDFVENGDTKRRKLDHGSKLATSHARLTSSSVPDKDITPPHASSLRALKPEGTPPAASRKSKVAPSKAAPRPITPPPTRKSGNGAILHSRVHSATSTQQRVAKETLNPRMVKKPPADHSKRRALLLKIHEEVARLNSELSKSSEKGDKTFVLSENEAIKHALDEEEKLAQQNVTVYLNVIKHRIVALKKMKLDDWLKEQKAARKDVEVESESKIWTPIVDTQLSGEEEVKLLSQLITSQEGLDRHGYVTTVPTEDQIETARQGVRASLGYEVCDRCRSRFQVYPDRREDGALTSAGPCFYHWGKSYRPPKEKGSAVSGPNDQRYSCCGQAAGSTPCAESKVHVFKISEAKRLASIIPFVKTPFNERAKMDQAVCFDCEMGYTVYGLELIRLTAISWPSGAPLIDVLVRPLGAVLDLNTRFSGVTPEQFSSAPPLDPVPAGTSSSPPPPPSPSSPLRIVPNPSAARALLLSHISCDTPLLGHALENDLNAVRLVHPAVVDTVLLFPHPRGLPLRLGLRALVRQHLGRDIQTAGAAGHDSLEDARYTGELVRFKVAGEWKRLRGEGWTIREGAFEPPLPGGAWTKVERKKGAVGSGGVAKVLARERERERERVAGEKRSAGERGGEEAGVGV